MINKLYCYSKGINYQIFEEIFPKYKICVFKSGYFNQQDFENNNVLWFFNDNENINLNKNFFFKNNVIIFSSKENCEEIKASNFESRLFCGPITIKKLINNINTYYASENFFYKDTRLLGEKIMNIHSGDSCQLTALEKKIMIMIINKKKIKRENLLETVFKIKRNIETKTIESHLTRIRKKLSSIKSDIHISLKGETFFIED